MPFVVRSAHCVVGVHAVGAAAVGHDLGAVGDLAEPGLQFLDRNRDRAPDVAGGVLGLRPYVEHDDVAVAQPPSELVAGHGPQRAAVPQVVRRPAVPGSATWSWAACRMVRQSWPTIGLDSE